MTANKDENDDDPRCGAKNRSGQPCKRRPTPGSNRCNLHGGKSLKGAAHPNYKHGRNSKHLPTRIAAEFEAALADPDLISHRKAIALLDVRWNDAAKRLHSGESGSLWSQLLESWSDFESAQRRAAEAVKSDDAEARQKAANDAQSALQSVGRIIKVGEEDERAWEELIEIGDKQSQIVVREQSRLRDLHQMMPVEEVLLIINAMHSAVADIVKDRSMVAAVGVAMERLLDRKGPKGEGGESVNSGSSPPPPPAAATVDGTAVGVDVESHSPPELPK